MSDRYANEAGRLQREQQAYLKKVRNGRRVAREDPADPEFSQQADDERQAKLMGLGDRIPYGPPKPGMKFSGR
jgi:hypothetical protein